MGLLSMEPSWESNFFDTATRVVACTEVEKMEFLTFE